jgi:capsular exopolysaccharide synthesis family protein
MTTLNLATLAEPNAPVAEAYRRLRVNLMSAGKEQPLHTILVAAAGPSKDKPQVVANLAVAFAKVGQRVIIVDCDLRHPGQQALFGLNASTGVTTAVKDEKAPLPLQATEVPGLQVLPAGPRIEVPSDLLASPSMGRLVKRLAGEADVVLFDVPPVTVATDAAELASQVDGVLLTVTAGVTKRDEAERAKDLLVQVGARVVGAALVNVAAEAAVRDYLAG